MAGRIGRRAAETALQASEARFHRLVEAMPLGLLLSDAQGRIEYANSAVERMLGYAGQDARESLTLHAICPELAAVAARGFGRDALGAESFEAACVTATGQRIQALIGGALLNPEMAPA